MRKFNDFIIQDTPIDELLSKITPENRHAEIDFSAIEKVAQITAVKVKRLHPDVALPIKAHASDAGFDLVAVEDTIIEPGETALIKTGLAFELPPGYALDIRPRSGITLKTKLRVQYGTVDAGYNGEVGVIVDNIAQKNFEIYEKYDFGGEYSKDWGLEEAQYIELGIGDDYRELAAYTEWNYTYIIRKGDRIAQAVIHRLPDVELIEVEALGESDRGEGGFGSTGIKTKEDE